MRGKVHLHPSLQVHLGITPAYAGKRRTPAAQQQPGRDHPRMCGEKLSYPVYKVRQEGSPPHVR